MFKTDSEPLNRLAEIINTNAHLLSETTVKELQSIYSELNNEYMLFENEVELNERLLGENEELRNKIRQESL